MFTFEHWLWILLCTAFTLVMTLIAKKRNMSLKTAGYIMTGISIASEFSKMMTHMIPNPLGGMSLDPEALPFHLCSMMLFGVFYITFGKDGKLKQTIINFIAVMGILGSICAILIPTDGTSFLTAEAYQCFVYHGGLLWFGVYLIVSKNAQLNFKTYINNIVILLSIVFILIYVNGALINYGVNFLFIVRPPVEGLPILNLNHGWYAYFFTVIGLGLTVITLFHLPFIIKEKRK